VSARLLIASHTYAVAHNRTKLRFLRELLHERNGSLLALIPSIIHEPWGAIRTAVNEDELEYVKPWPAYPRKRNSLRLLLPGWGHLVREFQPTHVHVEVEPHSLIALQLSRAARVNRASFSFFSWENLERSLPPLSQLVEWLVCWSAKRALAGSEGAHERLARRMPASRISVTPQLGVDIPPEYRRQSRQPPMKVIYVGRLVAEKGVLDLAEAALVCPEVRITFLGTGPLRDQLCQYAERGAPINVLDMVRHEHVREHLLENDVLVLPSRSSSRWMEQFGHVLIEAMAVGVVPVGSDSGAIPEVIGDRRLIFRQGDIEGLARILRALAVDPDWRTGLAQDFRSLALRRFSHQRVAEQTLAGMGALNPKGKPTVLLVADSPSELWPSMDRYGNEVSKNLSADGQSNCEVEVLQTPGPAPRNGMARRMRILIDRYVLLPSALRRSTVPIVHVLDQSYAHLVTRARPARVIVMCHDLTPMTRRRVAVGEFLYHRAVRGIHQAHHVIAGSEATRRQLIDRLRIDPDRITVIPYGVSPAFFEAVWGGPTPEVRILHVGSNADYKRIWLVVETVARLGARFPGIELWKVGESLSGEVGTALTEKNARLRNFGRIPDPDLPAVYAQATVLLFPSAHEGFGWPVAEAMAVGLPVITSDIECLRETTGGNAVHISADHPEAFAAAIERLLTAPQRLQELSDRGRRWATRYRWESHVQMLRRIYSELAPPCLTA